MGCMRSGEAMLVRCNAARSDVKGAGGMAASAARSMMYLVKVLSSWEEACGEWGDDISAV